MVDADSMIFRQQRSAKVGRSQDRGTHKQSQSKGSSDATQFMLQLLARRWWAFGLRGLFAVVLGLLALFNMGMLVYPAIKFFGFYYFLKFFGCYAILDGVFRIVSAIIAPGHHWPLLLEGIVGIIAGPLAILWPSVEVISVWAILTGVLEIVVGIRLHEVAMLPIFMGVISLLLGILIISGVSGAISIRFHDFVRWLGAYALVFGTILIALAFRLRSFRQLEA
jgi:uncharacterized membrane protein HdeD (DUF308 family)